MKKLIAAITALFLLAGCSSTGGATSMNSTEFSNKISEAGIVILDVRTPVEFTEGHIAGSINVDFQSGNFESEINLLDKNATYAVYCRSGNRSGQAVKIMQDAGFLNLFHLDGGVIDWTNQGLELVTQ